MREQMTEAFVERGFQRSPPVSYIPMVRKPSQILISFPLCGVKALSPSGGWEEQLRTLLYASIMSQFPLYTPPLQSEGCWLSGPPAVWGVWV